jgi:hypothetical protein
VNSNSSATYREQISSIQLPATVEAVVDQYDRVVGIRDRVLWKWIFNLFDEITLSSVPAEERAAVKRQKTLLTIFVTTLDDLVESEGKQAAFERARRVPFADYSGEDSLRPSGAEDTDDP